MLANRLPTPDSIRDAVTVAVLALLVVTTTPGVGAQETISSDRPGIGSGSTVIGAGITQLEVGVALTEVSNTLRTLSFGQAFIRHGLGGIELELALNSWVNPQLRNTTITVGEPDAGFEDVAVGAKLPLVRNHPVVQLSVQSLVSLPTGSDGHTADEVSVALNGLLDVALADRLGLSVNLSASGVGSDGSAILATVTPGISLSDRVGVYAGWAGDLDFGDAPRYLEGGVVLFPSADVQLDVNGAWSTNLETWFIGAGFATRWGG